MLLGKTGKGIVESAQTDLLAGRAIPWQQKVEKVDKVEKVKKVEHVEKVDTVEKVEKRAISGANGVDFGTHCQFPGLPKPPFSRVCYRRVPADKPT